MQIRVYHYPILTARDSAGSLTETISLSPILCSDAFPMCTAHVVFLQARAACWLLWSLGRHTDISSTFSPKHACFYWSPSRSGHVLVICFPRLSGMVFVTLPKALCKLGFVPLLCASRGKAECATSIKFSMHQLISSCP